ncbi:hypothetical protein GC175_03920 [bacterium]|nr:hypothetical protein [bacterium]
MSRILRLAFVADIHGNLPAFEATVTDIQAQTPDAVYLLGDLVNRCPWNNEVMALVSDLGWPSVQGNHDLVIGTLNTPDGPPAFVVRDRYPVIHWTWDQLHPESRAVLCSLPQDIYLDNLPGPALRLTHGIPGNCFVGITPDTPSERIERTLSSVRQPIYISAHTHRPLDRQVDGKRILNGGSVGMPYNGDPRAQYLILDLVTDGEAATWQPYFRQVTYNLSSMESAFHQSGMLEAGGPIGRLMLRTVLTGEPWISDFGYWIKSQPPALHANLESAVQRYLDLHGPQRWSFNE